MKFAVKSRDETVQMSHENLKEKVIIVSITDKHSNYPNFAPNENIIGILKLQFDDVEGWEIGHITNNDARDILNFVENFVQVAERIIVHCEYGISRSSGICAALMLLLKEKDDYVLENPYFCPNIYCYRSVLQSYFNCKSNENSFPNITNYRLSHTN